MVKPVIQAVVDRDCFAFIAVARLEWIKFESKSMAAVIDEFSKWQEPDHVRLHLDHIPVIDEDDLHVLSRSGDERAVNAHHALFSPVQQ